ncbi:conjugal transfer protein TraD [Chryseobacterium sp. NKUCC03_KSP]|uniref:conjugal transfer protein TraD n=1 Tax=Chryseobacterium sp. NKUCC03_KSP TaxID=2842125 RepID=UPI001C5AB6B6|nr:conjugal transfer protein TraD [Chryseobacterium sp. NKUCC03_KSP]MBW3524715.1 conjugal transfer protein TraD [Chryseobacterium sp. NKUCC03_KSP]
MEILILICLLIIIVLIIKEKIVFQKRSEKKITSENTKPSSGIMGLSKSVNSQKLPNNDGESRTEIQTHRTSNFEEEIDNKTVDIQIPQEELDDVFISTPDFEVEEEEWSQYQIFDNDNGLATGVTFEELNTVETFLKDQKSELSQKETAAEIIQKIHGTELFNLLENSIEGASIKIAALLDRNLSFENNSNSSFYQNKNFDGFDITHFT